MLATCPHSFNSRNQLTLPRSFATATSKDHPPHTAVKFAFHTGSRPKQINQPHASKRGHERGQGGPCREVPEVTEGGIWSRKENKLSKSEGSLLTQGPRHVSCHATATSSTQIRVDGGNKAREKKKSKRGFPCVSSEKIKIRGRIWCSAFRGVILIQCW